MTSSWYYFFIFQIYPFSVCLLWINPQFYMLTLVLNRTVPRNGFQITTVVIKFTGRKLPGHSSSDVDWVVQSSLDGKPGTWYRTQIILHKSSYGHPCVLWGVESVFKAFKCMILSILCRRVWEKQENQNLFLSFSFCLSFTLSFLKPRLTRF